MIDPNGATFWLALITYAKINSLTRQETIRLHNMLLPKALPTDIGQMWNQLDEAVQEIRAHRRNI